MLASSNQAPDHVIGWFAAEGEFLPLVEELRYLEVLLTSEGMMERAVMLLVYREGKERP